MRNRVQGAWLFLIAAGISCCAPAAEPLQHDLFARPPLLTQPTGNADATSPSAIIDAPWNPKLTAVMVAGKHSLVNIDGSVISIGQEKDGYSLRQVRDGEAVFARGRKRIVLKMDASALLSAPKIQERDNE